MNIVVMGVGVIGGALCKYLEELGHSVIKYDPPKGIGFPDGLRILAKNADAAFVCVPADTTADRFKSNEPVAHAQDLSNLFDALTDLANTEFGDGKKPVFIRTTVLPAQWENLRRNFTFPLYAMPEFVSAKTAYEDMKGMPIITNFPGIERLTSIFTDRPQSHFFIASSPEACCIAKYAHNVYGAMKITFFNAMMKLVSEECRHSPDYTYTSMIDFLVSVGHMDRTYTVIAPDGRMGYGGMCFPKDVEALAVSLMNYDDPDLVAAGHWLSMMNRINATVR